MNRTTLQCFVAAGVWACAPALRAGAPCTTACVLEVTNSTTLDLDISVAHGPDGPAVHEHLGPGESRHIVLASSATPIVTVRGARSPSMMRPMNVRVRCPAPTRSGDRFRSACHLASVSAVPGDSGTARSGTGPVQ